MSLSMRWEAVRTSRLSEHCGGKDTPAVHAMANRCSVHIRMRIKTLHVFAYLTCRLPLSDGGCVPQFGYHFATVSSYNDM